MQIHRLFRMFLAALALAGALALVGATPPGKSAAPDRIRATLFAVEFDRTCGPPIYPGALAGIVSANAPRERWLLRSAGPPPLVSREAVLYSVVGTSGETSLPAARVYAEVRGGGELSFRSDKGRNVVVQADVKSICWDVDQDKAMAAARKAGTGRVLLAVLRSEDLTADVNPQGAYGSQKSFHLSLDLTLLDAGSGEILGTFTDDTRVMDLSPSAAVRRGAKTLVSRGLAALSSSS